MSELAYKVLFTGNKRDAVLDELQRLREDGLDIEVKMLIKDGDFNAAYDPRQQEFLFIQGLTDDAYDAVILANNLGAGHRLGKYLPDALKARTVVVSNIPIKFPDRPQYEQAGIGRFATRDKLAAYLNQILEG